MITSTLLRVDNLVTTFSHHRKIGAMLRRTAAEQTVAVDGVSLRVDRGEIVALVGESGSGKTTVASSILRLVSSERGEIHFEGRDVRSLNGRTLRSLRRSMQMVYQDPYESLDPRFTVLRTVAEPLVVHEPNLTKAQRREKVMTALSLVGLDPPELYLDRYPHELSGGQRQRVAFAAAMALEPSLLIADEPISMLDVSVSIGILQLLDDLRHRNIGILLITHDLATAAQFTDRIYVMYRGRIVEEGVTESVIDHPYHPYTKSLIAAVPGSSTSMGETRRSLGVVMTDATKVTTGCRFRPRCPYAVHSCGEIDPQLTPASSESVSLGEQHRVACPVVTS